MPVLGELLFYRRDQVGLDDVLRQQTERLRGKIDALPDDVFSSNSDDEIAALIAKQEAVSPLVVEFAAAEASVQETPVEVDDRFDGRVRVAGLKATKSIPFKGDPALWRLRTNPFNMNPPRGDVRGDKLVIGVTVPAHQAEEAVRYIDGAVADIPQYLEWQRDQITRHNSTLTQNAMKWVQLRRQRLSTASDLLKKLGG